LVTSSLRCSTSERPSLNRLITTCEVINYPLTDLSRLQGLDQTLSPGWEPGNSLGFFSLSAQSLHRRDEWRSPSRRFPFLGFHNLTTGFLGVGRSLRVYSTPLALVGFDLQSFTTERSRSVIQSCLLLRRCPPHMGSFHIPVRIPACCTTEDYPYLR